MKMLTILQTPNGYVIAREESGGPIWRLGKGTDGASSLIDVCVQLHEYFEPEGDEGESE